MSADPGEGREPHDSAAADEPLRLRELRALVDLTVALISQTRPDRSEGERLVAATRARILELFPDKESTYDLILRPRFARLLAELPSPPVPARVLPFRRKS